MSRNVQSFDHGVTMRPTIFVVACTFLVSHVHAAPFDLTIKRSDVDLAACKTFQNGTPADANPDQVLCALGLLEVPPDRDKGWSAGSTSDSRKLNFAYTIVFKKPIAPGSI